MLVSGLMAVADAMPQAFAATQGQPQEAASSSSDSSVQECERIRGWLKPVRGSWPSYSWKGFAKRSRNAEAAAEAAAAHAAEAAEEETEVGLRFTICS